MPHLQLYSRYDGEMVRRVNPIHLLIHNVSVLNLNILRTKDVINGASPRCALEPMKCTNFAFPKACQGIDQFGAQELDRWAIGPAIEVTSQKARHPLLNLSSHYVPNQLSSFLPRFSSAVIKVSVEERELFACLFVFKD